MIRQPAVAGTFYPDQPERLRSDLSVLLAQGRHDRTASGIVVPHAGYVFSAAIAARAYKAVEIPQTVLLLGPDHHGFGAQASVFAAGSWRTPLGDVPVDEDLAARLLADCDLLEADERGHRREHSIEVQLPFLQLLRPDVRILPISLGHAELDDWLHLGRQIGRSLSQLETKVLLVASSDMNHFKSAADTTQIDKLAITQMENYAPADLFTLVRDQGISMCGVNPVVVMLEAARELGARSCQLLEYNHSGVVNGDMQSVVGYAALIVE